MFRLEYLWPISCNSRIASNHFSIARVILAVAALAVGEKAPGPNDANCLASLGYPRGAARPKSAARTLVPDTKDAIVATFAEHLTYACTRPADSVVANVHARRRRASWGAERGSNEAGIGKDAPGEGIAIDMGHPK